MRPIGSDKEIDSMCACSPQRIATSNRASRDSFAGNLSSLTLADRASTCVTRLDISRSRTRPRAHQQTHERKGL